MSTATLEAPEVIETTPSPVFQIVDSKTPAPTPTVVTVLATRRLAASKSVDIIALFKLIEPLIKKMSDKLKIDMLSQGAKYADGQTLGVAELRASSAAKVIDPMAFYKLCVKRGVAIEEIMGCITVGKGKAEEILSKKDIASICTEGATKEPSLYVDVRAGAKSPSAGDALCILSTHFHTVEEEIARQHGDRMIEA